MKSSFIAKLCVIYIISALVGMGLSYLFEFLNFAFHESAYYFIHTFLFLILFYAILPKDFKFECITLLVLLYFLRDTFFKAFFFNDDALIDLHTTAILAGVVLSNILNLAYYIKVDSVIHDKS